MESVRNKADKTYPLSIWRRTGANQRYLADRSESGALGTGNCRPTSRERGRACHKETCWYDQLTDVFGKMVDRIASQDLYRISVRPFNHSALGFCVLLLRLFSSLLISSPSLVVDPRLLCRDDPHLHLAHRIQPPSPFPTTSTSSALSTSTPQYPTGPA
jgi:hypothetical protein